MIRTMQTSFFGSPQKPLQYRTPKAELEEIKSNANEESRDDLMASRKRMDRVKVKPEVTIPEFEIHKKWYEYEKKIGKETKVPSKAGLKMALSNDFLKGSDKLSFQKNVNVLGNLKIARKPTGHLNPLIKPNTNIHNMSTSFDERSVDSQEPKPFANPRRTKTNLLRVKQYAVSQSEQPPLQ
jgi:hypothetical protein